MRILKKIPIHPTFFLLLLWFVISGKTLEFLIFFLVLLIHELGHFTVARKVGYKLNHFYLAPYGVALNYRDNSFESGDEIKIALAGPAFNLISSLLITSLWWVCPVIYPFSYMFVSQSLFLAIFNLLPAFPLDGGRVFINLFPSQVSRKKMLKFAVINNFALAIVFIICFIITCFYDCNVTLALAAFFLLSGVVDTKSQCKYEASYFFKKQVKEFAKVRVLYVSSACSIHDLLKKIDRNHYTIFYLADAKGKGRFISEKLVLDWSLYFPLTFTLSQITSQKTTKFVKRNN